MSVVSLSQHPRRVDMLTSHVETSVWMSDVWSPSLQGSLLAVWRLITVDGVIINIISGGVTPERSINLIIKLQEAEPVVGNITGNHLSTEIFLGPSPVLFCPVLIWSVWPVAGPLRSTNTWLWSSLYLLKQWIFLKWHQKWFTTTLRLEIVPHLIKEL